MLLFKTRLDDNCIYDPLVQYDHHFNHYDPLVQYDHHFNHYHHYSLTSPSVLKYRYCAGAKHSVDNLNHNTTARITTVKHVSA